MTRLKGTERGAIDDEAMETFVVRIFVPTEPGDAPALSGTIEQVGTRWTAHFASGAELLETVEAWLARSPAAACRPSPSLATRARERR